MSHVYLFIKTDLKYINGALAKHGFKLSSKQYILIFFFWEVNIPPEHQTAATCVRVPS